MPTGPARDLSGKKVRCWYVVAYAGQRDGVHYWKCMSRATFAEKVVAERDIISPKANALSSVFARCREAELNPTGWIYGEWTVVGPGEEYDHAPDRKRDSIWKCRCTCGTERDMRKSELRKFRSLSCGCRPHEEVRAERQLKVRQAYEGFEKACAAARRSAVRRELDSGWTPEMEQALRA